MQKITKQVQTWDNDMRRPPPRAPRPLQLAQEWQAAWCVDPGRPARPQQIQGNIRRGWGGRLSHQEKLAR